LPERYRQLKALQAASPEWAASEREMDIFHSAETEAVCGMIEVRPSTLAERRRLCDMSLSKSALALNG
jgi:hypothetical protein